jgi:hypothetical protein
VTNDITSLLPIGPMARRARVPARWLKTEAESGRIPYLRAGARMLFHPPTVERILLERATREAGPEQRRGR